MHTTILNTDESTNKWWALQDRRNRNIANSSHYTLTERTRAERMRQVLMLVYSGKVYDVGYGKKSSSIKIQNWTVRDKKLLAELETDWEKEGITKKESPQGVQYHIPKV
jgi:CO dehydrogenase/acetyl-CoA synthase alpha subunit